ncbi:AMP-binding protein [Propionibacteriaceae bacterium Y2011]
MNVIRPVDAREVLPGLRAALDGGPAIAPLPPDPSDALLDMVAPDRPAEVPDLAVVVATSGSTGTPKGVLLSRAAIRAGVTATHDRLGGDGDWTLAVPAHYVAGLMVIARTVVAGTALHHAAADLHDLPELHHPPRPQYLSLVPTQLVRALDRPEVLARLARYDVIMVGGGPLPAPVRERSEAAGLAVVSTYGMSETAGGCVYDGVPLPGVEVAIEPDTERIMITGPMLCSGYRLRPDLTREALVDGWFRTSDRGRLVDGLVSVTGRLDDVVISGGSNVDLAEVETMINSRLPAGHEVAVIGVDDPEWGTRVVAVTDRPLTREQLRGWLTGPLLPRQVVVLDSLPRTANGKIDRPALRNRVGESAEEDARR